MSNNDINSSGKVHKPECKDSKKVSLLVYSTFIMFFFTSLFNVYTHSIMSSSIEKLNYYMEQQLNNDKQLLAESAAISNTIAEQSIKINRNTEAIIRINKDAMIDSYSEVHRQPLSERPDLVIPVDAPSIPTRK